MDILLLCHFQKYTGTVEVAPLLKGPSHHRPPLLSGQISDVLRVK
jgi:hypothetical protein